MYYTVDTRLTYQTLIKDLLLQHAAIKPAHGQNDSREEGIATELVEAGVPKEDIVLGFQPAKERPYTGFAIA